MITQAYAAWTRFSQKAVFLDTRMLVGGMETFHGLGYFIL